MNGKTFIHRADVPSTQKVKYYVPGQSVIRMPAIPQKVTNNCGNYF